MGWTPDNSMACFNWTVPIFLGFYDVKINKRKTLMTIITNY